MDNLSDLQARAEQGDAEAQFNLGNCYRFRKGISIDNEKAAYWYTKAAEQGNDGAQFYLFECYQFGSGVPKDYEKAAYWLNKWNNPQKEN
jgi:TPR repeat protein